MKTQTTWTVSDVSGARYLGTLEITDSKGESHPFEVMVTDSRLVFGGACNAGFLESGYLLREQGESVDAALSDLNADLETFYSDGGAYVSRIVVNDRM